MTGDQGGEGVGVVGVEGESLSLGGVLPATLEDVKPAASPSSIPVEEVPDEANKALKAEENGAAEAVVHHCPIEVEEEEEEEEEVVEEKRVEEKKEVEVVQHPHPHPHHHHHHHGWSRYPRILLALWKAPLSSLVTATACAGYFMTGTSENRDPVKIAALSIGTFLQAGCANSINEVFEIEEDKTMARTRGRPLPQGHVSKTFAIAQAMIAGGAGTYILYRWVNPTTALLGFVNALKYMFIYTPLKKKHWLNTWVGTINGCLPPLMGYSAIYPAFDKERWTAAYLTETLYFWQITHFMAISFKCKDEYARAGYKMLAIEDPKGAAQTAMTNAAAATALGGLIALWAGRADMAVSVPLNIGLLLLPAIKFYQKTSYDNATTHYMSCLFNLPLTLVLPVIGTPLLSWGANKLEPVLDMLLSPVLWGLKQTLG